jgi:hypothetical protein
VNRKRAVSLAAASQRLRKPPGRPRKPAVPAPPALPLPPARVLTQKQAAAYLGISERSLRDLDAREVVCRVLLLVGPHERRRALYDVRDLDELIERRKQRRGTVHHIGSASPGGDRSDGGH